MLIAGYNIYNEIDHIEESVKSVYDHVGKVVFVDGRYKGFYEDKPVASNDGTVQWIKDKDNDPENKFHFIKAPKSPWKETKTQSAQGVKRSAYLIGEPGDTYLYLDGHEIVIEWRKVDLLLGEVAFARLDLPDEDPQISVKAPRIFAHQEGVKYITHSYLSKGKDEEFYLNLGWDNQTVGDMKDFWQRVPVEACPVTIKHIGKQKRELSQRQEQVKGERGKIEVFDHAKGLNFKVDSRVAVDRMAARLLPTWERDARIRGLTPPTFAEARNMVAAYAQDWEKKQALQRQKQTYLKTQMICEKCGFIATSMNLMMRHNMEVHPK